MYFTSATVGHIIAGKYKKHYVLKTVDGGKTWAVKDSLADGARQSWYDINFFNENLSLNSWIFDDRRETFLQM